MPDAPAAPQKVFEAVPSWAVQVVRVWVREYRYTAEYIQGTDDKKVIMALRRGDRYIGEIDLSHYVTGGVHFVRMAFTPNAKDQKPTVFLARSLDHCKEYAARLMEAICQEGCRIDPNWCEQCSQATRHKAREFGTPPKTPSPSSGRYQ